MSNKATIRKVSGGYIVEVRWPYGGSPLGNGEVVCTTFDEAVTLLMRHCEPDKLKAGETCKVVIVRDVLGTA